MADMRNCDVLIAGGGPAGIASAVRAAECGQKVTLVDDNLQLGGQIWRSALDGGQAGLGLAATWLGRLRTTRVNVLLGMRVVSRLGEDGVLVEGERESSELHYGRVILATGARERFLPFPGWTLPKVVGVGGVQALVKGGMPIVGQRVVVAGSGPLLLAVAAFLKKQGAIVQGIYEQASRRKVLRFTFDLATTWGKALQALRLRKQTLATSYNLGWWPMEACGSERLRSAVLTDGVKKKEIECDYLACGFGLVPNLELPALFECAIRAGRVAVNQFQETSQPGVFSAGEATGIGGAELSLVEGEIAGLAAAGKEAECDRLFGRRRKLRAFANAMEQAFALRSELRQLASPETIVCRCEDVPWSSIRRHQEWRSAKLHTRSGMGACQGRICGAALEFLLGWKAESVRPPIYPVRLTTLAAGRQESDIDR
jgi:NADPH-dependent 2,4-dienoyl-CoA reductase/sulfur reductase-like enzyme